MKLKDLTLSWLISGALLCVGCDPNDDGGAANPATDAAKDGAVSDGAASDGAQDGATSDGALADAAIVDGAADAAPATCDTTGFIWSSVQPAFAPGTVTDAFDGALAIDAQSRAHFILYRGGGTSSAIAHSHFAPGTGWSTPDLLAQNALAQSGWSPRISVNPAGQGLATYRLLGTNVTQLYYVTLAPNGDHGAPTQISNDNQASSALVSVDDSGRSLIAYQRFDTDGIKVKALTDLAAEVTVFDQQKVNGLVGTSVDPQGNGALFVTATETEVGVFARPFQAGSGFSAPERAVPMGTEITNGLAGAWLENGDMIVAFGTRPTPAAKVELRFAVRTAPNTWTLPKRFDTGDGTAHAKLISMTAAGPGAVFVTYQQPNGGNHIVRYSAASGFETPLALGQTGSIVAADRCGNAVMAYVDAGVPLVGMRQYQLGSGWQTPQLIETTPSSIVTSMSLAVAPAGQAMLMFSRQKNYYYATFAAP
jgi:hypothetical protein